MCEDEKDKTRERTRGDDTYIVNLKAVGRLQDKMKVSCIMTASE